MCKVYNQIGCLTAIKSHLRQQNVNEHQSLKELIAFQNDYLIVRQQIVTHHTDLIIQERNNLSVEIVQLNQSIKDKKQEVEQQLQLKLEKLQNSLDNLPSVHANIFQKLINYIIQAYLKLLIWISKHTFNSKVASALQNLTKDYDNKRRRHEYIVSDFENAVKESYSSQLKEHDRQKTVIDQINNSIYGALGEEQVVRELEKLSDDYILINDFTCKFHSAISYQKGNDYIMSIQIDHILVSPSGIFLIETKNWSKQSLSDPNLYSPVEQVKRANYAIYRMFNGDTSKAKLTLRDHLWGSKKIPTRNIVAFINHKPAEEFKYVKVLSLDKLLGYIKYFEFCLSDNETQKIADYLLNNTGR